MRDLPHGSGLPLSGLILIFLMGSCEYRDLKGEKISAGTNSTVVSTNYDVTIQVTPDKSPLFALETSTPHMTPSVRPHTPDAMHTQTVVVGNNQTKYLITAYFDYAEQFLNVEETITYVNLTPEPLRELKLVVEANRYPDVFRLLDVRQANNGKIDGVALNETVMTVPLSSPLERGSYITLTLEYDLKLPPRPGTLGFTNRQSNLGEWYLFIPPYFEDEGWIINEMASVGEYLVHDITDFHINICLDNAPFDLIIAASVASTNDGCWYRYEMLDARNFTWSASTEYIVNGAQINGVYVVSYVFPEHAEAGEAVLKASVDALDLFSDRFIPFHRKRLSVVEADFYGGMEFDGISFIGREFYDGYVGSVRGYLIPIAAHEVAHQWWYGMIGNDQAKEPWLDESLATYSELLFIEHYYPNLVDWWWEFRVNRFKPDGYLNSTIYDHNGFRSYVDAVYLRGAEFIHEIRSAMGDTDFYKFLRKYASENYHELSTTAVFFEQLDRFLPLNVSDLKTNYFLDLTRE